MEIVQTEMFIIFKRLLHKKEKKRLNIEIQKILASPDLGEETSDELEGILIYNYEDSAGKKRLCYSHDQNVLTLHLISKISQRI